jgi:hypothetical protein
VAAFTVVAAMVRFYGIGHQGFWFDEANSARLVRFSPGKMLGLPQSESTPPLYYSVAWAWARVFGHDEAGLRSLCAVAGDRGRDRPGLRVLPRGGARVDELDVIARSSPREPLCWWGSACNLIPSRMQRRSAVRGFRAV